MTPVPALRSWSEVALAARLGDLGPWHDAPLAVIELTGEDLGPEVVADLRLAPAVVAGVAAPGVAPSASELAAIDLVVRDGPATGRAEVGTGLGTGPGTGPGTTVVAPSVPEALVALAAAVGASPAAAVAAVQLLRQGDQTDVPTAVVAESAIFGLLRTGEVYRRWLADAHGAARGRGRRAAALQLDGAEGPVVRVERTGERLDVELHRPHVRNAVDVHLRDGLVEALAPALVDPRVHVHLWGAGPAFCAGGDLGEFGAAPDLLAGHLVRTTRSPALDLWRLGARVTAHVHGAAVGAGVEWAAFAGRVVARPDATFRLPEVAMGLVPGAGGTASVPARVGRHRAAWLIVVGATLDAVVAHRWGLVDDVVSDSSSVGPDRAFWNECPFPR